MPAEIPYNKLLALNFALIAARKGTDKVIISNEHLKSYFIRQAGERLSEKQLTEFADKLRPVVLSSTVERDQHGPKLVLHFNKETDRLPSRSASVWFENEATIRKALGLD